MWIRWIRIRNTALKDTLTSFAINSRRESIIQYYANTVQNKVFIILLFSEENIPTVTRLTCVQETQQRVVTGRKDDFTKITFTVGYPSQTEHLSTTCLV
jgi:hypothetical protein